MEQANNNSYPSRNPWLTTTDQDEIKIVYVGKGKNRKKIILNMTKEFIQCERSTISIDLGFGKRRDDLFTEEEINIANARHDFMEMLKEFLIVDGDSVEIADLGKLIFKKEKNVRNNIFFFRVNFKGPTVNRVRGFYELKKFICNPRPQK